MKQVERDTVYGVDGCRGGWICAGLALRAEGSSDALEFELYDHFTDCLTATADQILVVDIPIGLLDKAIAGGRPCDRLARQALGWPRRNSVFSPPARPALHANEYREAIRLNGRGMSQQAFRIVPKIREVDEAITPRDQARVFEGHPELAFMRMAGAAVEERKRREAGRRRRLELLTKHLHVRPDIDGIRDRFGRRSLAPDDVLDALALAATARLVLSGRARRIGDGERDARGLEMAIWY